MAMSIEELMAAAKKAAGQTVEEPKQDLTATKVKAAPVIPTPVVPKPPKMDVKNKTVAKTDDEIWGNVEAGFNKAKSINETVKLPAGKYKCKIVETEKKTIKGKATAIITFEVLEGPSKGLQPTKLMFLTSNDGSNNDFRYEELIKIVEFIAGSKISSGKMLFEVFERLVEFKKVVTVDSTYSTYNQVEYNNFDIVM